MSFIEDLTSGKLGAISELWQNFTQGLQIWWETTTTNLKLILQAFGQLFAGDWTALGETLQMIWDNTWQGIQGILSLAWENTKIIFTGMINGIINFFTQTDWGAVGRGILQGIVNGFNAYISWATGNMKSGINAILSAVKGFLGIRSPSKVFEMQVGYQMASGAALGWERGLDKLFSFQGLQPAAIDVPSRDLRVAAETGASSGNRNDNSASNDELARTIREHLNKHALSQAIVEALVQRGIGSR
jgi:phage-related protein